MLAIATVAFLPLIVDWFGVADFDFRFFAPGLSSAPHQIDLSVREIEDAGLREILQTPGAALGNWKILDALLDHTFAHFTFHHELGHAREVKTAISGLFGRFVARAYATRYLGLTHFAHVRKPPMTLGAPLGGVLRRVHGKDGDMPDWVAWGPRAGMAIVEAKGCHDRSGPSAALERAVRQAERAEIAVGIAQAPFKRYAIATRWGFATPTRTRPMLWVHDPDNDGNVTEDEERALEVGIARWHGAALLEALGHRDLAKALNRLARIDAPEARLMAQSDAHGALEQTDRFQVERSDAVPQDDVIGGFVTKGGVIGTGDVSPADQATLKRLNLRPAFVGIERRTIAAWIDGDRSLIEKRERTIDTSPRSAGEDEAGSWVVRLEEDNARIVPVRRFV
jgi:hypothetical protein